MPELPDVELYKRYLDAHALRRTIARVTANDARILFEQIKTVLQTAIDCGAGAERFLDRLPADYLLPNRDKGGECPRCGQPLATLKSAGRTSYFCPRCQPEA
jgi:formamidopyrimidine-DNA glycosylase